MPDPELRHVSAFARLNLPDAAGVSVAERVGLGIATLTARKGRAGELADTLRTAYGVALLLGARVSRTGQVAFVGIGPDSWLALSENGNWRFARDLARTVDGCGSVCDQSSGYGVLRLSGSKVRETLAKGVPVDLHPAAFGLSDAAVTLASHIVIVLWQVDEAPTYDLAVFRSYAESFSHWLATSAGGLDRR